ncbi:MAG: sulfate adenylyltransferase [Nitrospiria bacterium]
MSKQSSPHGGKLISRLVEPHETEYWEKRINTLKKIALDHREMSDLELIANGACSPLEGFMTRHDYDPVVHEMRLSSGLVWSLPITLAVSEAQAAAFHEGEAVVLTDSSGTPLGILHLEEKYRCDKEEEALRVFGTTERTHPGVDYLYSRGEILLGGKVSLIREIPHPQFREYYLEPARTRRLFQEKGWKTVVGFQTRNPIHRAHEYIQKCALEMVDGLLVHPLVGETKSDDIAAEVRMRCYEVLIENYYPKDRTLLAVFPAAMRYAGPREAIFHALLRKNYGCTHFIVGRDHAGVGNFYGPFDAHRIFEQFEESELGIKPLFFDNTFYCKRCGSMASHRTCPHDPWNYIFLSGTKVREMLRQGLMPPPEFTRPEVANILIGALSPKNGDDPVQADIQRVPPDPTNASQAKVPPSA